MCLLWFGVGALRRLAVVVPIMVFASCLSYKDSRQIMRGHSPALAQFPDKEKGSKLSFKLAGCGGYSSWCELVGWVAGMRLQLGCN